MKAVVVGSALATPPRSLAGCGRVDALLRDLKTQSDVRGQTLGSVALSLQMESVFPIGGFQHLAIENSPCSSHRIC